MEAPKPFEEKNLNQKPEKTIELSLHSDNNNNYDISLYCLSGKFYLKGSLKDKFNKKQYFNEYTLEDIKLNKFFYLHETIGEIYEELDSIIQKFRNNGEIMLLEETNKLILRIPLPSIKIKECLFELNEVAISVQEKFEDVFIQLNEMQIKNSERYKSLDKQNKEITELNNNIIKLVNELKEQNGKLKEQNNELKEQNNDIKSLINELKEQNKELKGQNNVLKEKINEINSLCNSINKQIQSINKKNDDNKSEIIEEIKDDNKKISQKLNEKISNINNYVETQRDKERTEFSKKQYEKEKEFNLIKSWINSTLDTRTSIKFDLIYKKTRDGCSTSDFHWRCDGKGKTVMVIETKEGLRFGGFKNDSWDTKGWKKNTKDFVFSLTSQIQYKHSGEGDSTYGHQDYVCFGNSSSNGDICFFKSMSVGYNGHCSFKTDRILNLQKGYFEAVEVEVYRAIY